MDFKEKADLSFNQIIGLMHEEGAYGLRQIADWIEKWQPSLPEIIEMLRNIADEKDAQSIVVNLRDKL